MTDLRSLRKKMNYEAIDAENFRVSKNTMDNLQKQVMLWEKPERAPLVSKEAALTIKSSVDNIIDILNNKIAVVNKLILERRGDLKDIMNNFDFINKYNQLIEPLITTGINKSKQNAIETNLQLIENPVSELTILLKKLMNDNEFIDFSRIEGVFNAFSIYKNVEDQIDRGNYYKITPERVRSMSADYIKDLNAEGIRLLDVAKQQANLPPNQRLQAYIDEMGPISKADMAKLKKLYGEPIEQLGRDLEQQLKSTREMFKDVMSDEGKLNRAQIDNLTKLLETQGTISQTKMDDLTKLYGANSAEIIKQIKESGELNKTNIILLAEAIRKAKEAETGTPSSSAFSTPIRPTVAEALGAVGTDELPPPFTPLSKEAYKSYTKGELEQINSKLRDDIQIIKDEGKRGVAIDAKKLKELTENQKIVASVLKEKYPPKK
jgi:hypothetical protein